MLRTSQQRQVCFSEQDKAWALVSRWRCHLAGCTAPGTGSLGGRVQHSLSRLPSLYVTLASAKFCFGWRSCYIVWISSFRTGEACVSLQGLPTGKRAKLSCRRLSAARSSCKHVWNCAGRRKFAVIQQKLLRQFWKNLYSSVAASQVHLCRDVEEQRGKFLLKSHVLLRSTLSWYVLFHALMWNLPVTDADGCRIKCTFLWLCQVDMQQRAQLKKLAADYTQSQVWLGESFSLLKVPAQSVHAQLPWCRSDTGQQHGVRWTCWAWPTHLLGFSNPEWLLNCFLL